MKAVFPPPLLQTQFAGRYKEKQLKKKKKKKKKHPIQHLLPLPYFTRNSYTSRGDNSDKVLLPSYLAISFLSEQTPFLYKNRICSPQEQFLSFQSRPLFSTRKEFCPHGSNFFPFRVDPFSEGTWCAGMQTGSH